jgi:putative protease
VTNNSGIAYEAYRLGIPWIAGPYMNIVNSFSLLCLKEKFHCTGAFISNEMNRLQVKGLKKPENFDLFYSIYHPNLLMTSRQCLFHQVSGCEKNQIDDTCMPHCEKSASMTNQKGITSFLSKTKGNYHEVYHETHYLNTRIIEDIPDLFSEYLVDLRDIETTTKAEAEKQEIARCFERFLMRNPGSEEELRRMLHPTTCNQYKQGI